MPLRAVSIHPSEDQIQQALFARIFASESKYPLLKWIFHSPNGGARPARNRNGHRYSVEGKKLQRMGVRKGVPDVIWPLPSGGYNGLAIELKSHTGRLSREQLNWRDYYRNIGWIWELHRDAETAWKRIMAYYPVCYEWYKNSTHLDAPKKTR